MAMLELPQIPPCTAPAEPPSTPRARFPFGIQLEGVRRTMRGLQGNDEMLLPFIAQLNTVIAPFTPILSLAGIAVALINCIKAIPDAISSFSPSPIISALEELVEKAKLLPQFVPGVPYVVMIRDIFGILRATVAEVETTVLTFNQTVNDLILASALADGPNAPPGLSHIIECALTDLQRQTANMSQSLSVLRTVVCALVIPIQIIEAFVPPNVREVLKHARCLFRALLDLPTFDPAGDLAAKLANTQTVLAQTSATLQSVRAAIESLETVLAAAIGESPDAQITPADCFADC